MVRIINRMSNINRYFYVLNQLVILTEIWHDQLFIIGKYLWLVK